MKKIVALTILSGMIFIGCKKKNEAEEPQTALTTTQEVHLQPYFGTDILKLDSTYTFPDGIDIQFTALKFFVNNPTTTENSLIDMSLFDYGTTGSLLCRSLNKTINDTTSIAFGIGVNHTINHNDPAAFPSDSPLNILTASEMHWGWNTGYIFSVIEGRVDTIPDGIANFDLLLSYHVGSDDNYQIKTIHNASWDIQSQTLSKMYLKLDMKQFFLNPGFEIDVKSEPFAHSAPSQAALTIKARTNLAAAITVE